MVAQVLQRRMLVSMFITHLPRLLRAHFLICVSEAEASLEAQPLQCGALQANDPDSRAIATRIRAFLHDNQVRASLCCVSSKLN